jgi:hypothetical protein
LTLTRRLKTVGHKHLLIATAVAVVTGGALAGGAIASAASPSTHPAGVTATTKAGVPWPAKTTTVFLYVDTEAAASEGVLGDCEQANLFQHGQQILFRVAGTETHSGVTLQPADVSVLNVNIPGVKKAIPFVWGEHSFGVVKGDAPPEYWTAVWTVPKNYPLGVVNFNVHAVAKTNSKLSIIWHQIPIVASSLTIVKA